MKKTVYIHANWNRYSAEFTYHTMESPDMREYGYVLVHTQELEFDTPNDKELRGQLAIALAAKKSKVYVDAATEAQRIDEEIAQLTALEHKPEELSL